MQGLIGGLLVGALVSLLGLGTLSVISEQPAGSTPPEAPLVDAPEVAAVEGDALQDQAETAAEGGRDSAPSSPVGSVTITVPITPALPEEEAASTEPATPQAATPEAESPRADTDPLDQPTVVSVEGSMTAPDPSDEAGFGAEPVAPVLPNPQGQAPAVPDAESDLTVSTAPAQPLVVIEPDAVEADTPTDGTAPDAEYEVFVIEPGTETTGTEADGPEAETVSGDLAQDKAPAVIPDAPAQPTAPSAEPGTSDAPEVTILSPEAEAPDVVDVAPEVAAPADDPRRLQMQGQDNGLLADRDTGVTVRRPGLEDTADAPEATAAGVKGAEGLDALSLYAADAGDADGPLMSITLLDDGRMSAAAAALSGLPFPVTIALDPAMPNARDRMRAYRDEGYEIAALAKIPEGAQPADVEVTLESVFATLPEAVALLDLGQGGLQADRAVTAQVMQILSAQGRGYATVAQGLNMATRAAAQAEVPAVEIYRDLDPNNQDARVVRRFVDQAAFRARQESGVVLVGRVRPDTISALILWGTANQRGEVDLVPLSAILMKDLAE
ncbi:divergent polysaccharide deacetylase family protein [Thalassorhabdomicrobium marinisediminis]|uniref:Divergent polysaccharide deacetylase family protein n=1 Tax=Thalassorhabdomicrobium marinisediminis TaxID=2170577 RepID=A0A2T7G1L7_9RHOB|nr:divergent polysaccharide deacetylase family protein [Thalassorhabdomicrobium marinisediminis]PVA08323.1 hypothetical protein DC363_02215 [Thalassorhabdomicrobium marinisediminis]